MNIENIQTIFSILGTYEELQEIKKFIDNDKLLKRTVFFILKSEEKDFDLYSTPISEFFGTGEFVFNLKCQYEFNEAIRYIIGQKIEKIKKTKSSLATLQ